MTHVISLKDGVQPNFNLNLLFISRLTCLDILIYVNSRYSVVIPKPKIVTDHTEERPLLT
jgi:hypothetical protein